MPREATKARGNGYFEARMRAAKWNDKLLTRAGAAEMLPGVTLYKTRENVLKWRG